MIHLFTILMTLLLATFALGMSFGMMTMQLAMHAGGY